MFEASNEEKKLDWMYKGAGSNVDREEYLLGRTVDKSLEQLNATEKHGTELKQPKNHVEHECIPPSIRDFQNLSSSEQVDLQQKLQEDPLVAIKKQEEETRRKLLQNPVQLKRLQDVLNMKSTKKKKKKSKKCKKAKYDTEELDSKFAEKYLKLKNRASDSNNKSKTKDKNNLDKMLLEKFKFLKDKLGNNIDEIFNMDSSSTDSDSDDHKKSKKLNSKKKKSKRSSSSNSSDSEDDKKISKKKDNKRSEQSDIKYSGSSKSQSHKKRTHSLSSDEFERHHVKHRDLSNLKSKIDKNEYKSKYREKNYSEEKYDSINKKPVKDNKRNSFSYTPEKKQEKDQESSDTSSNYNSDNERKPQKLNFGLVKADGSKIPLIKKTYEENTTKSTSVEKSVEVKPEKYKRKKLSEEELEKRRQEMMDNAKWRDNERENNVKRYRNEDKDDTKIQEYNPDFVKDQLRKSASSSTVESRIKSKINNIQRSKGDMNSHFSRRY